MRWLRRYLSVSIMATLMLGVLAMLLVSFRLERIVEQILSPVFRLGRWATPAEWQTLGNVLLGLFWFAVGIGFYGMIAGVVVCAAVGLWQLRGSQKQAGPGAAAVGGA